VPGVPAGKAVTSDVTSAAAWNEREMIIDRFQAGASQGSEGHSKKWHCQVRTCWEPAVKSVCASAMMGSFASFQSSMWTPDVDSMKSMKTFLWRCLRLHFAFTISRETYCKCTNARELNLLSRLRIVTISSRIAIPFNETVPASICNCRYS
jgi:hypothetical protein